jgi:hypothetical protein
MSESCPSCGEAFSVKDPKYCPMCGEEVGRRLIESQSPVSVEVDAIDWMGTEVDWEMIVRSTMLGQGCSWFRDRGEPAENDCTAPEPAGILNFELYEWTELWHYSKYFICDYSRDEVGFFPILGSSKITPTKALTFTNSRLGPRIEASLSRIGFQLSRFGFGEPDSMLLGTWGNGIQQPFIQWGEIYESDKGEEVLKWTTDLFYYTTRMRDEHPRVWSVHIPAVIENMLYLAEANIKTSWFTLARELSWDGISLERIPHPVIRFRDKDAAIISRNVEQGTMTQSVRCDTTISVAYDVGESLSDYELDIVMTKICDTFVELSSISVKSFAYAAELEEGNFFDVFGCDVGDIYPLASHTPQSRS